MPIFFVHAGQTWRFKVLEDEAPTVLHLPHIPEVITNDVLLRVRRSRKGAFGVPQFRRQSSYLVSIRSGTPPQ